MRVVVTGAAGFIGSNLCDALLRAGHIVTGIDNLSTGRTEFLESALAHRSFRLHRLDLVRDAGRLRESFAGADAVVHLAANADVRFGWDDPRRDLEQNTIATLHVLETMRATGTRRILFASTGSIYGDTTCIPTPEDAPFPVQTSLYGASKLAAEGYLGAYAEAGHASVTVFRFVSILGPRYTHGHVIDFVSRLRRDPHSLRVLGDGNQQKSYLEVSDCVAAILARLDADPRHEILNLGVDDHCRVTDSIAWITERMGVTPTLHFDGGDRGWVGDSPFIYLDAQRMRRARMGAPLLDPGSDRTHRRLSARE